MRQWLRGKSPRAQTDLDISERENLLEQVSLVRDLDANVTALRKAAGESADLVLRRFSLGKTGGALAFFQAVVSDAALGDLLHHLQSGGTAMSDHRPGLDWVKGHLVSTAAVSEATDLPDILSRMASGEAAFLLQGSGEALMVSTRSLTTRAIMEPTAETSLRGPREGFIESLAVNLSLIRRRIRTPNFWVEKFEIGKLTRTAVAVIYIKGLASEELLSEVRSRLQRIDTDTILESGQLEEFIVDAPFTIFPTVLRTERPDRVASSILEGRVGILIDGTPSSLVVPTDLVMLLQSPDDYYEAAPASSILRTFRWLAALAATFLPGTYVAVVNYHQELLPTGLLLRIAITRAGVPFPVAFEVFFMESTFELLREAGVRLPRAIGPVVSTVGALILGEAAIRAGMVSPGAVIVVAATAISSLTAPVPSAGIAGRLARFLLIGLGATLGLFGIQFGFILLGIHLVSLRSFGYPYFAPLAPMIVADLKDAILRAFGWQLVRRPRLVGGREPVRRTPGQRPRVGRKP